MNNQPCACIGSLYDEPHCYCVMVAKGLPLNEPARAKAEAELQAALAALFNWKARKSEPRTVAAQPESEVK